MRKVLAMACGMVLFAAASQGADDLAIARSALRDGLWSLARTHVAGIDSDEAKLITLESFVGEGRWDEVGKALSNWGESVKGDGFDYYRAVVSGDHAAAIDILKRGGTEAGAIEAAMFEAQELTKSGDAKNAAAVLNYVLARTNLSERVLVAASIGLGEVGPLRRAYAEASSAAPRRKVGLRLGRALLAKPETAEEGAKLIQAIVRDSPDAEGAKDAFVALVDAKMSAGQWQEASDLLRKTIEIWPDSVKSAKVQENFGWTALRLGKLDDALAAFGLACQLAEDDETRARTMLKSGDVLAAKGDGAAARAKYRQVLQQYPKSVAAASAKHAVELWELETKGRENYQAFKFDAAMASFREVAARDEARKPQMEFFCMLCLYGQGQDDAAVAEATRIASASSDPDVRARATLWLAKFAYNRGKWKGAVRLFSEYAAVASAADQAADALMWSARAAFAAGEFVQAIHLSTRMVSRYPDAPSILQSLIVQGEALIELARFDEAVLVFERVLAMESLSASERSHVQILKADALYAMGADNSARYTMALDGYEAVLIGSTLSSGERLLISFKIARTLEKLKRLDAAFDRYYSNVVLAYREGRLRGEHFGEEARAAFSRAAFWLADECESHGRNQQAISILELVAKSDVPAAEEAERRIDKISMKGRLL